MNEREVQVFGTRKDPETRKALRFFQERRIKVHFVDLAERAASPGELKRFAEKFGVEQLLNRDSRRFQELGMQYSRYSPSHLMQKLVDEPLLLTTPLVRQGSRLAIGWNERTWKEAFGR